MDYKNYKEYRVLERNGKFYVQVEVSTEITSGILWWKKTTVKKFFINCDDNGNQPLYFGRLGIRTGTPMEPYSTLKEAMDKIKTIITPDKIYPYEGDFADLVL